MLKNFARSTLFTSLIIASTSAIAATEVDFATTHSYKEVQVDKQYVYDALSPYMTARWNYDSPVGTPVTIYYAFTGEDIGYATTDDVRRDWHAYEKDAVVEELDEIAGFTNITFVETTDIHAVKILFRISQSAGNGASLAPRTAAEDVGYRTVAFSELQNLRYLNPNREHDYVRYHLSDVDYKHDYARSKWFIIHEIGHALGLVHPFTSSNDVHAAPLSDEDDHKFNTAMAYNLPTLTTEAYESTSFKAFDVMTLQKLYGKNVNKSTGDSLYEYDDTYDFHQTIIDTDGNDTISVVSSNRNNVIDLRGGQFSSIAPHFVGFHDQDLPEHLGRSYNSLVIDIDSVIENATGGNGDDVLVANAVANTLDGGNGEDTAKFAGNKADYTMVSINEYTIEVTSIANTEDKDTLVDMEFIEFADETVSINQAPVVTVTDSITVKETLQVTIDATATDAESDNLTYTWTQLDGTGVDLTGKDTLSVSFTAPSVDVEETINLQLVVSDGTTDVTNTVAVVVLPNTAPVITDVTANQTVDERTTVTLTTTATDADNDTLTYRWVVNGAMVTLTGSTTDTVTFTAPDVASATSLTLQVFVTDGVDEVSSETQTVTVNNVDVVESPKEKSSGGSFGYLIFLLAGLRFFRR